MKPEDIAIIFIDKDNSVFNIADRLVAHKECIECKWSVRQLERQITTFYYKRLLATRKEGKESVKNEIQKTEPKTDPDYILKDPYILEFLDLKENKDYHESDLEQALIDKLQEFLLELGKGFSFVARQKRITIEGDHYYIDLVFYSQASLIPRPFWGGVLNLYTIHTLQNDDTPLLCGGVRHNYILKCFVIINQIINHEPHKPTRTGEKMKYCSNSYPKAEIIRMVR